MNCYICSRTLIADPESVTEVKGVYRMPCCDTGLHLECLWKHVGSNEKFECPNQGCRFDFRRSEFEVLRTTDKQAVKLVAAVAVTALCALCYFATK